MAGRGDRGGFSARVVWATERARLLDDHCDRLQGNGSRRGTRGQLVEVPVEVQLAENLGFAKVSSNPHAELVLSVDNMNASVSRGESLNGAAEPGCDLLETDVHDVAKSVRAKNGSNAGRLETAGGTFFHFLKLLSPCLLYLSQLF